MTVGGAWRRAPGDTCAAAATVVSRSRSAPRCPVAPPEAAGDADDQRDDQREERAAPEPASGGGVVQSGPDITGDRGPGVGGASAHPDTGRRARRCRPTCRVGGKNPGRSSAATSNIGAPPALAISGRSAETSSSCSRIGSYSCDSPGDRNDGSGSPVGHVGGDRQLWTVVPVCARESDAGRPRGPTPTRTGRRARWPARGRRHPTTR